MRAKYPQNDAATAYSHQGTCWRDIKLAPITSGKREAIISKASTAPGGRPFRNYVVRAKRHGATELRVRRQRRECKDGDLSRLRTNGHPDLALRGVQATRPTAAVPWGEGGWSPGWRRHAIPLSRSHTHGWREAGRSRVGPRRRQKMTRRKWQQQCPDRSGRRSQTW